MTPELALDRPAAAQLPTPEIADLAPAFAGSVQPVVAVVGLGYVGLPTAVALRGAGIRIVGIDVSQERLQAIRDGRAELLDSEQQELRGHLGGEGFVLTGEIAALDAADLVLICVPTPIDAERRPDPQVLRAACASVVRHARAGQTIVLTSTTYVGTTRELLVQPLAERGMIVGEDVFVAFAPERIDPGVPDHEQLQTPRVLGAVTETATGAPRRSSATPVATCTASPRRRRRRWSSSTRTPSERSTSRSRSRWLKRAARTAWTRSR